MPLGYRIVAAGAEWVTPPNSAECEPTSTESAVTLERFDGVSGAARIITARRREQGAERNLIGAYQQNENRSHQLSLDVSPVLPSVDAATGSGSLARHR